jgi:hypothetical protein
MVSLLQYTKHMFQKCKAISNLQLLCFWSFRRLDSVSFYRCNLLIWAPPIELVPISGHQHQHKIGYVHKRVTNHPRELRQTLYILSCVGTGVRREGLALSIGSNWVGSIWRRRQNPASETLCVLNENRTMDNVQKHNGYINISPSQILEISKLLFLSALSNAFPFPQVTCSCYKSLNTKGMEE